MGNTCAKPQGGLDRFRSKPEPTCPCYFTTYVVRVKDVLDIADMVPHEAMLQRGLLHEYQQDDGILIFVSHEWLGVHHPDPGLCQLKCLQRVLKNLIDGSVHIGNLTPVEEVMRLQEMDRAAIANGFIWLDFWAVPQLLDITESRPPCFSDAIRSIPYYCGSSHLMLVIAPSAQHENQQWRGLASWRRRGWCRLERAAAFFAAVPPPIVAVVNDRLALHCSSLQMIWDHPLMGDFTVKRDKKQIEIVLESILLAKEQRLKQDGQNFLHQVFRCLRPTFLVGGVNKASLKPSDMSSFLAELGMKSSDDCGEKGWTPLHFAALTSDVSLVKQLLDSKAPADAEAQEPCLELAIDTSRYTPLELASCFAKSPDREDIICSLLQAGADINHSPSMGYSPLHMAIPSKCREPVELLIRKKASVEAPDVWGHPPLVKAAMIGTCEQLQLVLNSEPRVDVCGVVGTPLHALATNTSIDDDTAVKLLTASGCDPNVPATAVADQYTKAFWLLAVVLENVGLDSCRLYVNVFAGLSRGATPTDTARALGRSSLARALEKAMPCLEP